MPFLKTHLLAALCSISLLGLAGCGGASPSGSVQSVSAITWTAIQDGEVWFRNSQIQLRFDGDMYCRVFLQKGGKLFSINDIPPDEIKAKPPHFLVVGEEEIKSFHLDYRNIGVSEMKTQFGSGKRLHLAGYAQTSQKLVIEKKCIVELYADYPDAAIVSAIYRNTDETSTIQMTRAPVNFFRMDAARSNSGAPSNAFWIFFGDLGGSGLEASQQIGAHYSRTVRFNQGNTRDNQAVPLIDLWTSRMGMAIGDLSLNTHEVIANVAAAPDQKIEVQFQVPHPERLGPLESFKMARSVWMVHTGDFQTALQRYKELKQKARQPPAGVSAR